ncbi:MAG: calcium/proton exchanger [bacterium]
MQNFFLALLVFVPVAIGAHFLHISPTIVFFLCALAIVPLAKFIGEATEELSSRTNSALGGLLNATFGNATELIIGIFALRAGLIEVVKASITGSIIGNLLLVLGFAMFAGGWKREKQSFNKTGAVAGGSTLFLAVIALVMPAIFLLTAPTAGTRIIEHLSLWVSCALILMYLAGLFFSLRTHKHLYTEEVGKYEPRWSVLRSVLTLLVATLLVSWVSEILVGAIEPLVLQLGWTELFVGVIFIAIIGNAAEHASAITVALKNRMDLALNITIGSATQIAMLVAPLLVIISLFFHSPMNLVFNIFELIAIVLSVLMVNLVVADGESNWLEGAQLLIAYAIIAVAFFFHP